MPVEDGQGQGPTWVHLAEHLCLFQSERLLLYDTLQGELQERIQRLEEDRQSLDISSGEAGPSSARAHPSGPQLSWLLKGGSEGLPLGPE